MADGIRTAVTATAPAGISRTGMERSRRAPLVRQLERTASLAPWLGFILMTALWLRATRPRPRGLSREEVGSPEIFDHKEPGRGRAAERPRHIPSRGWGDIAWRVYREVSADRLPVIAGGVTFHIMLALVPAVGVFISLYGLFADVSQVDRQVADLAAFVPPEVLGVIRPQMTRLASEAPDTLSTAFVVSLLLSLWTASLGMRVMVDALNVAYEEVERRNVLLRFALTYLLTFAALLFFVVVAAVMAAAPLALQWLGVGGLLIPLRWVVLFLIVASSFAIFYRFGPSRTRARWSWVRWGAVFAALIWMGGSLGYSWYVNTVARFDATYGSLGAVVGFLFWIWFSVMAVLLGAELNAEIEHQTAVDTTVGEPKPMGSRGAAVADSVGLAFVGFRRLWAARPRPLNLLRRAVSRRPGPAEGGRGATRRGRAPIARPRAESAGRFPARSAHDKNSRSPG